MKKGYFADHKKEWDAPLENEYPLEQSLVRDKIPQNLALQSQENKLAHITIINSQIQLLTMLMEKGSIRAHDFSTLLKENTQPVQLEYTNQLLSKLADLYDIVRGIQSLHKKAAKKGILQPHVVKYINMNQHLVFYYLKKRHISKKDFIKFALTKRAKYGGFQTGTYLHEILTNSDVETINQNNAQRKENRKYKLQALENLKTQQDTLYAKITKTTHA